MLSMSIFFYWLVNFFRCCKCNCFVGREKLEKYLKKNEPHQIHSANMIKVLSLKSRESNLDYYINIFDIYSFYPFSKVILGSIYYKLIICTFYLTVISFPHASYMSIIMHACKVNLHKIFTHISKKSFFQYR